MIKTLRITSILAAVLAVILGGFFVFRIVHGISGNEKIKEFLDSPSVVEKFRTAEGNRTKNMAGQRSPLVQQAQAFALYLNPPAPKRTPPTGPGTKSISSQVNVTPKFPVIGISYCENRPEMSMALIDEPGKGIHWVKQSAKVGHFVIEQVNNDSVIVKSGSETFNLALERKKQESPKPVTSSSNILKKPPVSANRSGIRAQTSYRQRNLVKRVPQKPQTSTQNAEKKEELEQLYEQLRELKEKSEQDDSGLTEEERAEQIEKIISSFKASYVSPEEAKKLDDLAQQLQDSEGEPNSIEIEEELIE
jgi:type II secretory pathway component PulC